MAGSRTLVYRALPRRMLPLIYGLIAIIIVILLITWLALRAQVDIAGFLNAESIWSKSQKEAVIALDAYAENGKALDYARFERSMTVLLSDRYVRDAVRLLHYDGRRVALDLAHGSVMATARTGMVFTMRHLTWAPYVKQAFAAWHASDEPIDELAAVARQLHAMYLTGVVDSAVVAEAQEHIDAIDDRITPLTNTFSLELARGAQWFGRILFLSVLGAALLGCLLWLLLARWVVTGIRESHERYHLLFDTAPDAIVMFDEASERLVSLNRTAKSWTGRDPLELRDGTYAEWCRLCALRELSTDATDLLADHNRRPVETHISTVNWGKRPVRQAIVRDVSERVVRERTQRIAAQALASIAEGVMIADSRHRVVSVNDAACRITGFAAADLVGRDLGWSRRLADGSELFPLVWAKAATEGRWSGEVQSLRHNGDRYAERLRVSAIRGARQQVAYYVAVFNDISQFKADRERLHTLATRDALTGLVNRAEFLHRCETAIARAERTALMVAVLFVDLDAFKFVNDSYTHATGDRLLRLVGARISGHLRKQDVLARMGGDEFTVLLEDLHTREEADTSGERLLAVLREPFHLDGYEITISASIGVASYPVDGGNAQILIANADMAMYSAKTAARNACRSYAPTMRADAQHRVGVAADLRHALEREEFRLVYQPIVDMQSRSIIAAEALLRWQHPERGAVLPGEFIDIADSIGLAYEVGAWVMDAACAQMQTWRGAGLPPIRMAINVSARWFAHPAFIRSVAQALDKYGVPPEQVVLELTEGTILKLGEQTTSTMRVLAEKGMRAAIDDFGTGYASMAYLKLPAVSYLKIDRSFINGLPSNDHDTAIVRAILAMAKAMRLTVMAEGVETEAQHRFLLDAHCPAAQGFLYSYPLAPMEFERLMNSRTGDSPSDGLGPLQS